MCIAVSPVAAQDAPPPPPPPPAVGGIEVPASDPLATLAGEPAPRVGQQHWVTANWSILQPFVGRVAVKVLPRPDYSLWLEAYAGSVLFDAMYGFGGRLQHTARVYRDCDAMMVSPGLGVHILPTHWNDGSDPGVRYFLAADVDISWLHDFTPHYGFEFGVKLGLAGRLSGPRVNDSLSRSVMFGKDCYPILALFSGLRF